MRALLAVAAALLLHFASGCSSPDDTAPDASADAAPPDGATTSDGGVPVYPVDPPLPPAPPELPRLSPCPAGFGAITLEHAIDACEPLPGDDGSACPPGQSRFVGETGCQPIGTTCPAGAFPETVPAPALFVDPSAAAGGDGTRALPFRTAVEAYAAASAGTTVVLSRGDHAPLGLVPSGVSVRGACVAETRVVCPSAGAGADIDGEVTLTDITFEDCAHGVYVRPDEPSDFHLESLLFTNARSTALSMFGGEGTGRSLVFRGGLREATADGTGWGIGANLGPRFTASRVTLEGVVEYPVLVSGEGTDVTLEDILVRDVRPSGMTQAGGHCSFVNYAASLTIRRALLASCRGTAVSAYDPGTTLVVEDAVVRGITMQESDRQFGMAVLARLGADATVRRLLVEDADLGGVWALNAKTTTRVEDLVVHRANGDPLDRSGAMGVVAAEAAQVTGARVAVYDVDGVGVNAQNPMTRVALEDVHVWDLRRTVLDGVLGLGAGAFTRGALALTRAHIEGVHTIGVLAITDSTAELTDLSVTRVQGAMDRGTGAVGVCALEGGQITLERGRITDIEGNGVSVAKAPESIVLPPGVAGGTPSLDARDLVIDGTRMAPDGTSGGLVASHGSLDAMRVVVANVQGVGVLAYGETTTLTLAHAHVHDVAPIAGGTFGYGVDVELGTPATISDVIVERTHGVGLFLSQTATTITRVAAIDTAADEVQQVGRGLVVQSGAQVTLTDGIFARSGDQGVYVNGVGTELVASGVHVLDVGMLGCETCALVGVGLGAYNGGHASLTDFEIRRSTIVGVHVGGGEIDLSVGEVSSSPIGANISTTGYDIARISDRVLYYDNGTNLDSAELPVPSVPGSPDVRPGGF